MPLISRAIAVLADAVVLGFTLWRTIHIFRAGKDVRAYGKLTATLAYNGTPLPMLFYSPDFESDIDV